MAEILFYHLTESTLEEALPGLLERSVERGWRAVVQTGTEERRDALDQGREHSPLTQAQDAVVVDTTDRSVDQIVDDIMELLA